MARQEFHPKVKRDAFARAAGHCEACTAKLFLGKFHYDHIIPDQLGGEPTLENCQVLCLACHTVKTAKHDIPRIAKSKRVRAKHIGAKSPSRHPLPGGKNSPWRKKINGQVERR